MAAQQERAERRRSQRVLLVIPVEATWETQQGICVQPAETEEVSAHGALLRMKALLPLPKEFELTHRKTRQSTRARVVEIRAGERDGMKRIAVELAVPSETFWGISIPPLHSTAPS
ncbi:MAG: PilZ domain-containing protein [Terriglobia bacterium]